MLQTIELRLEDKPGALMRVAGIYTAKGCNIRSLTVTPEPAQGGFSRMIVVAEVEPRLHSRIIAQINRLVQVLEAEDVSEPQAECAAC